MKSDKNFEILNVDFECSSCKKLKSAEQKIPVSRIIEKLDACFDKNDLYGAEKLLEYWQGEAAIIEDLSGELSMVNEMLGLSRKISNREKAKKAISRASELLELTDMSNKISGATIMINMATTAKAFGNPKEAIPLYEKAALVFENQLLPKSDPKYAALYNNHATSLVELGSFEEALTLYEKAIGLTKDTCALDCAVTYVNMAHLYEAKEGAESEQIYECLKKAEVILDDERIVKNGYCAFVYEKCAPSFDYFGQFLFAKKLYKISREIYERA